MRHSNSNRKLSKPTSDRMAMLSNIVISLFEHGKIKTSITRAKEARKMAEKVITLSKKGDVPARRSAFKILNSRDLVKKVFTEYATRYEGRPGGYTRLIKVEPTKGDNAPMALIEFV